MSAADLAAIAAARAEQGDGEARARLIDATEPMVLGLARRFAGRVPVDDLRQSGAVGVLLAARSFDPARGKSFEAYASAFIVGEMLALIRTASGARVTRSARELAATVDRAAEALTATTGRSPTIREIAAAAGIDEEQVVDGMRARAAMAPASDEAAIANTPDDRSEIESAEARLELGARLSRLDPRLRRILALRFGLELSQREIADRLGISQMHVSRLLRGALERIDRELTDDAGRR
jgi:RNA polymerase sigma-B factor